MVSLRLLVVAVAVIGLCGPASAQSRDAEDYLGDCTSSAEVEWCKSTQETFPADLAGAFAGEYQGIRNVAYCVTTGCQGAIKINKREGCAWRAIAYAAAPTGAEKISEQQNMDAYCKGVSEMDILAFVNAITPMLD